MSKSHAIVDDKDSNSTGPSSTTPSAWGTRGRSSTSPPQASCSPPKDDSGASKDIVGAVVGRRVAIPTPCSLLLHHLVVDAKKAGGSIPPVSIPVSMSSDLDKNFLNCNVLGMPHSQTSSESDLLPKRTENEEKKL